MGTDGGRLYSPRFTAPQFWGIAFLFVLAIVVLIWLPIGTNALPQIEEWEFFGIFREHGPTWWIGNSSSFKGHRVRPLFLLPYSLAYALTTSHLALHAELAIALLVKGISMAYIALWLTRDRAIALAAAVVFVVYPADTMQMGFRAVGIVWAAALTTGAIAVLLLSTERSSRILAACAAAMLLASSLMYEAALLLGVAPLVLWMVRFGTEGFDLLSKQRGIILIWVAGVVACIVYIACVYEPQSYQGALLSTYPGISAALHGLFAVGLYRALLQCWYDGLSMMHANLAFWPYLVVALAIVGTGAIAFKEESDGPSVWEDVRLIIGGAIVVSLGYAPYLVSVSHMYISQRTYIYASIGATVAMIGVVSLLKKVWLAPVAIAVMIAAGFGSQWEQFGQFTDLSNRQRMYLSGILNAVPDAGASPNKAILIDDRTGALANTWMLRGVVLQLALQYLYDREVSAAVCTAIDGRYSAFSTDQYGVTGRCVRSDDGVSMGKGLPEAREVRNQDVISVVIEPDGKARRFDGKTTSINPALAERWKSILGCFPCSYEPRYPVTASFRYDFGRWWSLEDVPWGGGWRGTEWIPPPKEIVSYSWMVEPQSNLYFRVKPEKSDYRVAMRVMASISPEGRSTLALSINGTSIQYTWTEPEVLSGTFDGSLLTDGMNELKLTATSGNEFPITNAIDWIEIEPAR